MSSMYAYSINHFKCIRYLNLDDYSRIDTELADDKFATQRAHTNPSPTSVADTAVFNSTSAAKVDSKLEDVLLGRHTDDTTSNTNQIRSLYPEGIELHPHQEDMHYGPRCTHVSFCCVYDMCISCFEFLYL